MFDGVKNSGVKNSGVKNSDVKNSDVKNSDVENSDSLIKREFFYVRKNIELKKKTEKM